MAKNGDRGTALGCRPCIRGPKRFGAIIATLTLQDTTPTLHAPPSVPVLRDQPGHRHRRLRARRHPRAAGTRPGRQRTAAGQAMTAYALAHRAARAAAAAGHRPLAAQARAAAGAGAVRRSATRRVRWPHGLAVLLVGARADGRSARCSRRWPPASRWRWSSRAARPGAVAGVPGHEPELCDRRAAGRLARAATTAGTCRSGLVAARRALALCARGAAACRATLHAPGASFAGLGALLRTARGAWLRWR